MNHSSDQDADNDADQPVQDPPGQLEHHDHKHQGNHRGKNPRQRGGQCVPGDDRREQHSTHPPRFRAGTATVCSVGRAAPAQLPSTAVIVAFSAGVTQSRYLALTAIWRST